MKMIVATTNDFAISKTVYTKVVSGLSMSLVASSLYIVYTTLFLLRVFCCYPPIHLFFCYSCSCWCVLHDRLRFQGHDSLPRRTGLQGNGVKLDGFDAHKVVVPHALIAVGIPQDGIRPTRLIVHH